MCTNFQLNQSLCLQVMAENAVCEMKAIILKFCSLVSRDWLARYASNLVVDSPSSGASWQQIRVRDLRATKV